MSVKKSIVTITIGYTFSDFDFVVETFEFACAYWKHSMSCKTGNTHFFLRSKLKMPNVNEKTPEEMNSIIFKAFMYPINDVEYIPNSLIKTTFKKWLKWIEISDINTIKQLSNPAIWPLIDDNVFLIPKNLTLKQITEFYRGNKELILYEINKSDITTNRNKYYVKDYLLDMIAFDEHFISRQCGDHKGPKLNTVTQKKTKTNSECGDKKIH